MSDELRVNLGGNASGFKRMLDQAKVHTNKFASEVSGTVEKSWMGIPKMAVGAVAGLFAVGTIKNFVTGLVSAAAEAKDMAEQLGMGVEDWQRWEKAADKAHVPLRNIQTTLQAISELQFQLTNGTGEERLKAAKTFGRLGVGPEEAAGMRVTQLAQEVAKRNEIGNLQSVLGRPAGRFRAAADEFWSVSATFSESDAAEAQELEAKIKSAKQGIAKSFLVNPYSAWIKKTFGSKTEDVDTSALPLPARAAKDSSPLDIEARARAYDDTVRQWSVEDRIRKIHEGIATPLKRRIMLEEDLATLRKRQAEVEGKDFSFGAALSEDEKRKVQMEKERQLNDLTAQIEQNKAEQFQLNNRKDGMEFSPSGLARVGGYSRAELAFNPFLTEQARANEKLTQIEQHTRSMAGRRDAFAP